MKIAWIFLASATSPKPPRFGTPKSLAGPFGSVRQTSGNFPVKKQPGNNVGVWSYPQFFAPATPEKVNDGICAWLKPLHAWIPKIMAVCGTCISGFKVLAWNFWVSKHQFVKFQEPQKCVLTQPFFLENSFRWNFPTTEIWQPTIHLSPRSSQHPHTHDVSLGWSWQ